MKKYLVLLSFFIFPFLTATAQEHIWSTATGGVWQVAVDHQGNTISVGYFTDTVLVDFDPGPGTYYLPGDPVNHKHCLYILKLDPSGNMLWAKQLLLNGNPRADVTVDQQNNIYVCSALRDTVDFFGTTIYTINHSQDICILRLSETGTLDWVKKIGNGSSAQDYSYAIAPATTGIVVSAWVQGIPDVDPGPGEQLAATGGLLLKLDFDGNYIWHHTTRARELAIDEFGHIYSINHTTVTSQEHICKRDSMGNPLWIQAFDKVYFNNIAADASGVYATGGFVTTADLKPGPGEDLKTSLGSFDAFLLRLDPIGQYKWSIVHGSAGSESGSDMALVSDGTLIWSGNFQNTIDFNPGVGVNLLTAINIDGFVQKLDTSSNHFWAKSISGQGIDNSLVISLDPAEDLYITASGDSADLDPGANIVCYPGENRALSRHLAKWSTHFPTAISDIIPDKQQLTIYPNPSQGTINIAAADIITQLTVYDVTGRKIFSSYPGTKDTELHLSANGIYFIHANTKTNMLKGKLVVSNS